MLLLDYWGSVIGKFMDISETGVLNDDETSVVEVDMV